MVQFQDEVDWWEENQQYSIKNWKFRGVPAINVRKVTKHFKPDPDFVISDPVKKCITKAL